jgi:hypothetical protein
MYKKKGKEPNIFRTAPKSNQKMVKTREIENPQTHFIHGRSPSLLSADILIERGWLKLM